MRFVKLILLLAVIAAGVAAWLFLVPYGPSTEQFVDIAPGTTTARMARQLQQAGIIRSAYAFEAIKAVHGGSLKAGEYRFDHPAKVGEVYERIRRGDVYAVSVVIPEGFNIFDVADAIARAGLYNRDEFLAAEQSNAALVQTWNPHAQSVEGFLFPDTYKFGRHAKPADILALMIKRFDVEAARLGITPAAGLRVVTLASLVEREVHLDAERPTVASVFENRLAAGMPLQTDPAVQYASMLRGTWTGVIHQSELHSDSPYNTYTHPGLPPGPICNPGLAALRAALHPAKTEYLYFVADSRGATRFARTLDEHNLNVAQYRASMGMPNPTPEMGPPPPAPPAEAATVAAAPHPSESARHPAHVAAGRHPAHGRAAHHSGR